MPSPGRRGFDDTPRLTETGHIPTTPHATPRTLSPAERQARYRAGHRATGRGHADPVWAERRNGYPFKPYVYCGTGPFDAGAG